MRRVGVQLIIRDREENTSVLMGAKLLQIGDREGVIHRGCLHLRGGKGLATMSIEAGKRGV